jgi:hypothetical protein
MTDVAGFAELMREPRTLSELVAITGLSLRTVKDRVAAVRKQYDVAVRRAGPGGAIVLRVKRSIVAPPPPPRVEIVPSRAARIPMHMPLVRFALECLLSIAAGDGAVDDNDVDDVAGFIAWPPAELAACVQRVFRGSVSKVVARLVI